MESENIALIRNIGSVESVKSGITEVQMETQQGNVYMNGEHR